VGVGIVGMGKRGGSLALNMAEDFAHSGLRVSALCSRTPEKVAAAAQAVAGAYRKVNAEAPIALHTSVESLIHDSGVDLIVITSPQHAHAQAALPALRSGKKVFLDKPIAHTLQDAQAIADAERQTGNAMLMGFTRRYEAPWHKAFSLLREGAIGSLHMIQIRSVVPYDIFFHGWHRRRDQSGDALNDKSSHHFDVFNWFSGSQARSVSGIGGRAVYVADPQAPARCPACEQDCPYRANRSTLTNPDDMHSILGEFAPQAAAQADLERADDRCVFAPGADILDHALIQARYANGVVASLVYCIFGPKAEDQETLELIGSAGRLMLTRHTGRIDLVSSHGRKHEVLCSPEASSGGGHFGADLNLIRKLREFADGAEPVVSGAQGLAATRMALTALQSVDAGGRQFELPGL
jgi:predicted dehydrogenase